MVKETTPGGNANINGDKFENIVIDNFFYTLEQNGYQVDEESVIKTKQRKIIYCDIYRNGEINTGHIYARYASQDGLKILLDKLKIIPDIEKEPDGIFLFPDRKYVVVLEIKSQKSKGSVLEKLYGCDGFRDYDYCDYIFHNKYKVDMSYVFSHFFEKLKDGDSGRYFKYMDDHNIKYHFGNKCPLALVGFEEADKTIKKESEELISLF